MWNMSTDLLGGTNKEVPLPICSAGLYSAVSPSILCPDWRRLGGGSDSSFVTLVAGFSSPLRLCSLWKASRTRSPCVVILCRHGRPLNVSAPSTQRLCKHVCSVSIRKKHISNLTFSVLDRLNPGFITGVEGWGLKATSLWIMSS